MKSINSDNFLALDVGFRSTGMALFTSSCDMLLLIKTECVKLKRMKDEDEKYASVVDVEYVMQMAESISKFIDAYGVKDIVVELPHGGAKSSRAARLMGMASAMIATIVVLKNLNVQWFTPKDVKEAATGKSKAEKDEIMDAIGKLYPEINSIKKTRREHIADAIAVGLALKKGKND